ncbi:MAG: hypothetical protein ACI94Y_004477 [Maribacter sp.]|jgi:hypothetical protein
MYKKIIQYSDLFTMRKRFESQNSLDGTAISDVKIDIKSRHQLSALLVGLQ